MTNFDKSKNFYKEGGVLKESEVNRTFVVPQRSSD